MKRVLIVGFTDNPGGIENVIMNYYRNVNKENIQFDFLSNIDKIAFQDEITNLGGRIINIPPRTRQFFKYKKYTKNFFKKSSSGYVAIWVNFCNITNLDYLKYAKKYGIKTRILHSHNSQNMASKVHLLIHRINRKFINKYVTDYWACSDDAAKWFFNNNIINNKKYKIINNAIQLDKFQFNEEIRKNERKKLNLTDKFVIGNVGRFQYQKNHEFLIDIYSELNKKMNNLHLLLIGDGEEREKLEKKVKELKLNEKVTFVGIINDVPNKLQAMDMFLFPSRFEGLSLAAIEAQTNGLPVFASKDVITEETKILNNFTFISLEKSASEWADIIFEKYNLNEINRELNIELIRKKGFDIKLEAKKIEDYLCNS